MFRLLQIELYKIFKRPRTYIAFAVITAIILLIQIALFFGGGEYVGLIMSGLNETFEAPSHEIMNGYLVSYIILNLLLIHVPILVALVAGDIVAGEANMGTLRLIVIKPISRTQLFTCQVYCGLGLYAITPDLGGNPGAAGEYSPVRNQ